MEKTSRISGTMELNEAEPIWRELEKCASDGRYAHFEIYENDLQVELHAGDNELDRQRLEELKIELQENYLKNEANHWHNGN